ncbi:hypothetical protein H0H93_009676 [Arthromyces matolae]|nr:hypothetical protein H0H93_009676 [Arthromyces matolae]
MSVSLTTSLKGKVAIVTGSSRGIGAALALRLAEDGANVVINYVSNAARADDVVNQIKALNTQAQAVAIKADASTIVGGKELVEESIKAFGKVDILVCNAGIMGSKTLVDVDEKFFDDHFNSNVKGPFFLAQTVAPLLPSPGGRIIFFGSSLLDATGVLPNALTYVASKGAIEQITRVLAKDLGARGITVNMVSPGPVDTDLFRAGKPDNVIAAIAAQNPSNRLGLPEDIAPIVSFVSSPAAQWINGQNVRVNGAFVV